MLEFIFGLDINASYQKSLEPCTIPWKSVYTKEWAIFYL